MCRLVQTGIPLRSAHNDTAGIEVVIQSLALSQELRREDDIFRSKPFSYIFGIANRDGTLDDHDGIGINALYQLNDFFHMRGVEIVLSRVVVGGSGNNHKVRIAISCRTVKSSCQVQWLFRQIFFDIFVLYR